MAAQDVRHALESSDALESQKLIAQCKATLALVRDDSVSIIADDGVDSRLYLAHDAGYRALQEAVAFFERAVELDLLNERWHDEGSATLLDDADNALLDFREALSRRLFRDAEPASRDRLGEALRRLPEFGCRRRKR